MIFFRLTLPPPTSLEIAENMSRLDKDKQVLDRNWLLGLFIGAIVAVVSILRWQQYLGNFNLEQDWMFILLMLAISLVVWVISVKISISETRGYKYYAPAFITPIVLAAVIVIPSSAINGNRAATYSIIALASAILALISLLHDYKIDQIRDEKIKLVYIDDGHQDRCNSILNICRKFDECEQYRQRVAVQNRSLTLGEVDMFELWAAGESKRETERQREIDCRLLKSKESVLLLPTH